MKKNHKEFVEKTKMQFFVFIVIVLLVILVSIFIYSYYPKNKNDNYLIQNKYYGFEVKTPKNWIAEQNMSYSEDAISQLLSECKNDTLGASAYEIGAVKFEDQKYPDDFGATGNFPAGFKSGGILQITVNCIPNSAKNKIINYSYGNLEVGGEKAFDAFLNSLGFGNTKYISFSHDNYQYKVSEYVYISPTDKGKVGDQIINNETAAFNTIISSFKFVK